MITQERLRELFDYDPGTGLFTRRIGLGGEAAGSVAGTTDHDGYVRICVDKKTYRAHRLAWLYIYGEFPPDQVDHINRQRSDNRIENLRLSTPLENGQNQNKRRSNTSGVVGVHWYKRVGKWQAYIMLNKRSIHLGYFDSIEEAAAARAAAKEKLHTFHPEDAA